MSIDPKDPRLTAYALGELDDNERRAFEAEMDADARGEVAAIREAAEALRVDLASETTPGLKPAQREAITAAAGNRKPRRWIWPAAAAALLVSVSLVVWNATRSIVSGSLSQPIALFEMEEAHSKLVADAPATNTPSLRFSEAVRLEEFKEQLLRSRSPSGRLDNLLASNSEAGAVARFSGVSIVPGSTALTWMPVPRSSAAIVSVRRIAALFVALYGPASDSPARPARAATFTIAPDPRASMWGTTARFVTKTERALRLTIRSQSSTGVSCSGRPAR